jgi:multiple sugar transport system permease protein
MAARIRGLRWAPYALVAPSLVFLAVFFALPMFQSFSLALESPGGGFGLDPIRTMLDYPAFGRALLTTLLLILLILPIQFVLAMSMALVVNANLKGRDIWLYIFALPLGISELAAGIVWFSILTETGWLNTVLEGVGMIDRPVIWLDANNLFVLVLAIVVAESWRATSIVMIILVAGLQGIPRDYLEAADVFGATPWKRVWHVILPMLRPTLRVALILRTILAFQAFAVVVAIAGTAARVLAFEAYWWYSRLNDPRTAAAFSALILLLSLISTILYLVLLPARGEEQAA